jgi:hypothetical protein
MDTLKHECNHFRARAIPQHSNSRSNNKMSRNFRVGQSGVDQEGWEAEPMDTEDNVPIQVEMQEEPQNDSTP